MKCVDFERGLFELLEGDAGGNEKRARLAKLREHAAACPECAGSNDLLTLLELPPAERDLATDPGEAYWADFNRRVRERTHESPRAASPGYRRWLAIAAAGIVLVVGAWSAWRLQRDNGAPVVAETMEAPGRIPDALPEPLERSLVEAVPEDVMAQVNDLAGWSGWNTDAADVPAGDAEWAGDGLFPDVSDLDDESRESLLRWLEAQSS